VAVVVVVKPPAVSDIASFRLRRAEDTSGTTVVLRQDLTIISRLITSIDTG
jgi:hypothetical protein